MSRLTRYAKFSTPHDGIVKHAIILAGGLGIRLRRVLRKVPKPMAPVNGVPFLEHLMDYWVCQGINKFTLSVGYKHEIIVQHFGENFRNTAVGYAIETSHPALAADYYWLW
jgi:D-glycero-alpha-D-manno-heptose 1-phosphate guanylyltransferase